MGVRKIILEGKIFSSKRYGDFEVLEYLGSCRYSIKFIKTGTTSKAFLSSIKQGAVMDRFYPIYFNVGFLGDKYDSNHFLHNRWFKMLCRCYNNEDIKDYPNYGAKGITVCDRWYNFSNYVADVILLEGYNEELVKIGKLELDKDVINREAKTYSPETCKWITKSENTKEMNKRVKQKISIATRLSDGYSEEFYNITDFCNKYSIPCINSVSTCLLGKRNDYFGWKFEYKENPIKYIHQNRVANKSGYKGVCKTSDGKIIARYNWEIENQGVYRKPDAKDDYLKEIGYINQKSAN